jgi:site-specific recombinase XerD
VYGVVTDECVFMLKQPRYVPAAVGQPTDRQGQSLFMAADGTVDDARAVAAWLMARAGRSPHTYDAYRRESTRLLMWLSEQQLTLAQLNIEDLHRYYAHLVQPPAHWIRPRKPRQDQPLLPTQLLVGGLSARSLDYSRRVLGLLFDYLHDAGYVPRSLVRLSLRPAVVQQDVPTRWISPAQWRGLWQWLANRPRDTALQAARFQRDRWLFLLLYQTGLRREEVAHACMGDVQPQHGGWVLQVVGKGQKHRQVTLHTQLMDGLAMYRQWLGLLSAQPQPQETIPLVCALSQAGGLRALTPRAIGLIVQQVTTAAALDCPDPHDAERLRHMSTHWLRHTNATHRLLAGASLDTIQDELGHADPKTTRLYAQTLAPQRRADVERFAQLHQLDQHQTMVLAQDD